MTINCQHGYFRFYEDVIGDAGHFNSFFGLDLVRDQDFFTFSRLESAPKYSLLGKTYLGAVTTQSFQGEPWEVMEANGLVYNFQTGLLVQILSITTQIELFQSQYCFISKGLILPGSLTKDGKRVKSYQGHYSFRTQRFKYSEVTYVG